MASETVETRTSYTVRVSHDCDHEEIALAVGHGADEWDIYDAALDAATAWFAQTDWGASGVPIEFLYAVLELDSTDRRKGTAEVQPDHYRMIIDECGGESTEKWLRSCSNDPESHRWKDDEQEDIGWPLTVRHSHCRTCVLSRAEQYVGDDLNLGEDGVVRYDVPET